MSRNSSGIYTLPSVYLAVNDDTIDPVQHNSPLEDIANDLNLARPIVAGGTGAASAPDARAALNVPGLDSANVFTEPQQFEGDSLSSMIRLRHTAMAADDYAAFGVNSDGNVQVVLADGSIYEFTASGEEIAQSVVRQSYGDARYLNSQGTSTGDFSTTGNLITGRGSGGVALTINDGEGNANVTFNHKSSVPEQDGTSARITANTDSTSAGSEAMRFELGMGTAGVPTPLPAVLILTPTTSTFSSGLTVAGEAAFSESVEIGDPNGGALKFQRTDGPGTIQSSTADPSVNQIRFLDSSEAVIAQFYGQGVDLPSAQAVLTREKADNRFARLGTANSFNGTQTILGGTNRNPQLTLDNPDTSITCTIQLNDDGNVQIRPGETDGELRYNGSYSAIALAANTVLARRHGDARYQQSSSDAALKFNVQPMPDVGSIVDALEFVTFDWLPDDDDPKPSGTQYGVIAQQVQSVLPSAARGEDGSMGVDLLNLIGVLGREVQSLRERLASAGL